MPIPQKIKQRAADGFCIFNPRNDWPESWEFPSKPERVVVQSDEQGLRLGEIRGQEVLLGQGD